MKTRKAIVSDHPALGAIQLTSWHTMFPDAGIEATEYLAQFTLDEQTQGWLEILLQGDDTVFVAENDHGEVVGYVLGRPIVHEQFASELVSLHILPDFRKQGTGHKLIAALANDFKQQGIQSILLWVLSTNPARKLYERLGGEYVSEQHQTIGKNEVGLEITEVAYGWRDIQLLCDFAAK